MVKPINEGGLTPHTRRLSRFVLLPELKLTAWKKSSIAQSMAQAKKTSDFEVCPKCANPSSTVYDHRIVKLKDAPVRGTSIVLSIKKRRFFCKPCKKPFTEPVRGVGKRHRTTQRFRKEVLWACENFSDLDRVRRAYRCSSGFIYKCLYEQLELRRKKNINYPWPASIGIDEHFFSRRKGYPEFATVITDNVNKRLREVAYGKIIGDLKVQLQNIPGRENVREVALDLSDSYKTFAREFFPNAKLVADKFHVIRLLVPSINKRRVGITGDKRFNPLRRLLLTDQRKLKYFERDALTRFLIDHPELYEVYNYNQAMYRFYRIKGEQKAARILTRLTDAMAGSTLPEIKRLRKTLVKWRQEILNYFRTGLTNARTEGFNNVAKLVQKRGYGYRSFENYRLRLLNACC